MSKKLVALQKKSLLPLAAALAFFASTTLEVRAQAERGGAPGDFDYYVLSLSWSPTYCSGRGGGEGDRGEGHRGGYDREYEDNGGYGDDGGYGGYRGRRRGGRGQDEQCSGIRPYAFVLHGLWPQYERRGWPEMCETGRRPWVSGETIDHMMDIMPSRRLVIHEYRAHGTCSGLDPEQYFEMARKAYGGIHIPDAYRDLSEPLKVTPEEVRKAFLDANPQLGADMLQITCSRDLLREVHVCLTKDLAPRACGRDGRDRCSYGAITMPPVRGGGAGPHGGPSYGRDGL